MTNELPQYLLGQPLSSADLRTTEADFQVVEMLGFLPSGEGEHLMLEVEKTGVTTHQLIAALAKWADIGKHDVGYAGLKDKYAVTRQWLTLYVPHGHPDVESFAFEGVKVLSHAKHNKKLRQGIHKGNRFTLTLRNVSDKDDVIARVAEVSQRGVPNYFGEQRFGREGANLEKARRMFDGWRVRDRNKRSMYLSAARSYLFNHILGQRIVSGHFDQRLAGDVFQLAGSKSVFADDQSAELDSRLEQKDIQITAPLWGRGQLMSQGEALALEQSLTTDFAEFTEGLEKAGLKQERRVLALHPQELSIEAQGDELVVSFILPPGTFATAVLRELCEYSDQSPNPLNKEAKSENQESHENTAKQ